MKNPATKRQHTWKVSKEKKNISKKKWHLILALASCMAVRAKGVSGCLAINLDNPSHGPAASGAVNETARLTLPPEWLHGSSSHPSFQRGSWMGTLSKKFANVFILDSIQSPDWLDPNTLVFILAYGIRLTSIRWSWS